jgi:hybrid cluster-associated redox disulfide protein
MLYFKTSQIVPGKGDAWMYYECNDDQSVRRYMTYIPVTGELDKVPNPFIKKLQRPDMLMDCSEQEFLRLWPESENGHQPNTQDAVSEHVKEQGIRTRQHFDPDMTVVEAMSVHPQVAEVFTAFHLGGCSSCGISEIETVAQVCMGYGVDIDILMDVLEGLMDEDNADSTSDNSSESDESVATANKE